MDVNVCQLGCELGLGSCCERGEEVLGDKATALGRANRLMTLATWLPPRSTILTFARHCSLDA